VDSIAYSLTVGFWSGRRRRRRRRRTGEARFNIKSNNPNLEGGELLRFEPSPPSPPGPWGGARVFFGFCGLFLGFLGSGSVKIESGMKF